MLKDKIAKAPEGAGVYLMRDESGRVIYIGKAKNLKKRLMSYLSRDLSAKTMALMRNVHDIEYRTSANETLALLIEASLIHQYRPKYNVSLRDDKSFPMVKITNEEFPAIYVTRKEEQDGARYVGPFTSAKMLKSALRVIRRSFPYRSCKSLPKKACIYYRLKLSPAPCIGKINKQEYAKIVDDIAMILDGKSDTLIKKLSKEMELKSRERKFEEAAAIRDQINALSLIGQSRKNLTGADESSHCAQGLDESEDLRNLLGLDKLPLRIEAFDISNISGREAAGSMVNFYKGLPDKSNYRRFRIKTVSGIDDYAMLKEAVHRRYSRLIAENIPFPDLIIIDGGRGHLLTAEKEIKDLGIDIPLVSIAKDKENIYAQNKETPIRLNLDTPALNLMRRVRDEAHRFAVSYHHILRRKKIIGK